MRQKIETEIREKVVLKNIYTVYWNYLHVRFTKTQKRRREYLYSNRHRRDYLGKHLLKMYPHLYQLPF